MVAQYGNYALIGDKIGLGKVKLLLLMSETELVTTHRLFPQFFDKTKPSLLKKAREAQATDLENRYKSRLLIIGYPSFLSDLCFGAIIYGATLNKQP